MWQRASHSESNIIKLEFIESNQFKIENESQSNKNKNGYQLLVAHPNIYSAISSLKIEEVQNLISFYKAKKKKGHHIEENWIFWEI